MTDYDFDGAKFAADPILMATATSPDFVSGDSNSIARRSSCNCVRRMVQQRSAGD